MIWRKVIFSVILFNSCFVVCPHLAGERSPIADEPELGPQDAGMRLVGHKKQKHYRTIGQDELSLPSQHEGSTIVTVCAMGTLGGVAAVGYQLVATMSLLQESQRRTMKSLAQLKNTGTHVWGNTIMLVLVIGAAITAAVWWKNNDAAKVKNDGAKNAGVGSGFILPFRLPGEAKAVAATPTQGQGKENISVGFATTLIQSSGIPEPAAKAIAVVIVPRIEGWGHSFVSGLKSLAKTVEDIICVGRD